MSSFGNAQPLRRCAQSSVTSAQVTAQVRVSLGQHPEQHVRALAAGRRAAQPLVRVHPLIRQAHRLGDVGRSRSEAARRREVAVTLKASPCSVSAADAAPRSGSVPVRPSDGRARRTRRRPSGRPAPRPLTGRREVAPQPREQCIAGRMAEGVVVCLEAVEVEQRQQQRALAAIAFVEPVLQVGHQAAAVRHARQRSPCSAASLSSRCEERRLAIAKPSSSSAASRIAISESAEALAPGGRPASATRPRRSSCCRCGGRQIDARERSRPPVGLECSGAAAHPARDREPVVASAGPAARSGAGARRSRACAAVGFPDSLREAAVDDHLAGAARPRSRCRNRSLDVAARRRMLSTVISKCTIAGFGCARGADRRRVRDHPLVRVRARRRGATGRPARGGVQRSARRTARRSRPPRAPSAARSGPSPRARSPARGGR